MEQPDLGYIFSKETDKIVPAFIQFQSELKFAKKTSENPYFKSKYADLSEVWAVIREPLAKYKFGIMQFPSTLDFVEVSKLQNKVWINIKIREIMITTLMMHESGQWVKTYYRATPDDNSCQSRGTAITYFRRYALMPLCGVCPEDDDGNDKTQKPPPAPKSPAKPKPIKGIKDKNGRLRYLEKENRLDDSFQKSLDLIVTAKWIEIQTLIKKNIGGDANAFGAWINNNYGVNFYDIKNSYTGEIIDYLKTKPKDIIENKKILGEPEPVVDTDLGPSPEEDPDLPF